MKRALVALLLVAACATRPTPSADAFLESVVGVEASGCSLVASLGSGTVLADNRVVTSAHTVAGSTDITVIDARGRSRSADLVGFDPTKDLAVLRVADLEAPALALGRAGGDESGWVLAWNRDEGSHAYPMTVTKRVLVTIEDIYVDGRYERRAIEIDAEVAHGDSGGAVITATGEVIGLVYATSRIRSAGFALNDEEIAAALAQAVGPPVDPGPCL